MKQLLLRSLLLLFVSLISCKDQQDFEPRISKTDFINKHDLKLLSNKDSGKTSLRFESIEAADKFLSNFHEEVARKRKETSKSKDVEKLMS